MKLCVKKIYCPVCQRLVTCREEKVNNITRVLCSRCGGVIWAKDRANWRYEAKTV